MHRDLEFHFHVVVVHLAEDRVFAAQYGTEGIDLFQCAFKVIFGSGYRSHLDHIIGETHLSGFMVSDRIQD